MISFVHTGPDSADLATLVFPPRRSRVVSFVGAGLGAADLATLIVPPRRSR